jgi:hypothetical protein
MHSSLTKTSILQYDLFLGSLSFNRSMERVSGSHFRDIERIFGYEYFLHYNSLLRRLQGREQAWSAPATLSSVYVSCFNSLNEFDKRS